MITRHIELDPRAPIGVFDSGVGGLDVAAELTLTLPHERLIYLGDTARVPYGTRTPQEVKRFTEEAVEALIKLGVKAVVLACNTASAWALEELKTRVQVPLFGMIEAGVEASAAALGALRSLERASPAGVLILATPRTIDSGAYQRRFLKTPPFDASPLYALACPVFVPLVEAGWAQSELSVLAAARYLQELIDREGEQLRDEITLVLLGCTHYPLLREAIEEGFERVLGRRVQVVDGARRVSLQLKATLETQGLSAPPRSEATSQARPELHALYTTGELDKTRALAERFWRARLGHELPPLQRLSISA